MKRTTAWRTATIALGLALGLLLAAATPEWALAGSVQITSHRAGGDRGQWSGEHRRMSPGPYWRQDHGDRRHHDGRRWGDHGSRDRYGHQPSYGHHPSYGYYQSYGYYPYGRGWRPSVWVPGYWAWNGWTWIWVPGYWR